MSRSNPNKRKRRHAERVVLCVGEGASERAFMRHIAKIFGTRDMGVRRLIVDAGGGSPENVIRFAVKKCSSDTSKAFVLYDDDMPCSTTARRKASNAQIECVVSIPCLEGLLLAILTGSSHFTTQTTQQCKEQFYSRCMTAGDMLRSPAYESHFTRDVLLEARTRVPQLERILQLMFLGQV